MEKPVSGVSLRSSPGLIAAYGFDEESGNRILDASGQGNDGLLDGAVRAAGQFGRALVFDGHRDQVLIPYAPVLNLRTSFTLEAWARPEVTPNRWPAAIQKESDHYFLLLVMPMLTWQVWYYMVAVSY